ncbi:MAG: YceI family protein [Hyphomonadaceae bacterium]
MAAPVQRYTAVAIVLHWAIAFAILFMIPLGWWMGDQAEDGAVTDGVFRAYQLHKSIGLTVLALSLVRLGWRLANPPPPLPAHMPQWERIVAKATHWAFYVLMIALPLTGWLYVSAGWSEHDDQPLMVTTHWFGLFVVPHLFGLPGAGLDVRESVAEASMGVHSKLAWAALVLAALHVAAALKHHFFDRDETLAHMVPGLRAPHQTEPYPKNPTRLAVLGGGLALVAVATFAALFAFGSFMSSTSDNSAPQAQSSFEVVEATPDAPAAAPETAAPADPAAPSAVPAWRVDARASSIGFAFTYTDDESGATRFQGRFTRWRADIRFDPQNLDQSSVVVTIDTASATDGVAMHDNALSGADWFNTAAYPTATFRSSAFRRQGEGYVARGTLTMRGRDRDVDLPFALTINGASATMTGSTSIDRRDFDIGKDTDADDLISRDIDINVRVEASRAP